MGRCMAYQMREEPGPGTYRCTNCDDWEVTLDEGDQLPPCGNCGEGQDPQYEKVD